MHRRTFRGAQDLPEMQAIVAERTAVTGIGTNLHPGDIPHRIYNGLRRERTEDVVPVWEEDGRIVAYALIWPRFQAFDFISRIDLPDDAYATVLDELVELTDDGKRVETDVVGDDERFTAVLSDLGFVAGEVAYHSTTQPLPGPEVPASTLGLRSATHGDAAALAAVHSSAFGSDWSPAMYAALMDTPGYDPERELVAIAEDGTFAGFAVTWYDRRNSVGYFEPVGVASEHQRRGVGRLLLAEGMRRMSEAGMTTAAVWHSATDERAIAFYRSCGFTLVCTIRRWYRGSPPVD